MKKILSFIISAVLVLSAMFTVNITSFADEILITVGGKSVTSSMSAGQIINLFGQPKLTTDSIFGGNAYAFYGDNYSNYLYVDTNANGQITSYGSVSKTFTSPKYSYGDTQKDNYVHKGEFAYDDSDKLYGYIGYTKYADFSQEKWEKGKLEYNKSIWRHSVVMWNAICSENNCAATAEFDERTYYTEMQLADNDSNLYEYCRSVGSNDYKLILTGSNSFFGYWYPNPLKTAQYAENYDAQSDSYAVFSFDTAEKTTIGFLSKSFFSNKEKVEYTADEKEKLAEARKEYMQSVNTYNSADKYYDIEPQYEKLPITAGKININKESGALGYLNAIRTAAGLNKLEYSEKLAQGAQNKAALTMYLSINGIDNPNPHFPAKPNGVSDEFYSLAQCGSGENLFMGDIITGIMYALEDSYGSGQYYSRGHRYNLLDPNYKYFGIGSSIPSGLSFSTQSAQKFDGYQSSDLDMVAWPPSGIMPEEAGQTNMFTAKFYKNYSVTDSTTVSVECLNSAKKWEFTSQSSNDYEFKISTGQNMVSFYNSAITMSLGDVFKITLHNVKDSSGDLTDYSYRTVYESLYSDTDAESSSVTLDKTKISMAVGGETKITAKIAPEALKNKMIRWTSSDNSVATVNENGIVKAIKTGSAVITATMDNGTQAVANVNVVGSISYGDVNGDGKVTASDVLLIRKSIAGQRVKLNEIAADVNCDGKLTASDVLLIRKKIAGQNVHFGK